MNISMAEVVQHLRSEVKDYLRNNLTIATDWEKNKWVEVHVEVE